MNYYYCYYYLYYRVFQAVFVLAKSILHTSYKPTNHGKTHSASSPGSF